MIKVLGTVELGKRWGRGYKRATFTVAYDTDWDMYEFTNMSNGRKSYKNNKYYGFSFEMAIEEVETGLKLDDVVYTALLNSEEVTTEEVTTEEVTTEEVTTEEVATEEVATVGVVINKTVELGYMGGTQYEFKKDGLYYLYISDIRGFRRYVEDGDRVVQDACWCKDANEFYSLLETESGKEVI